MILTNKNPDDELGWVSPSGQYFPVKWGFHDEFAKQIVKANWLEEYENTHDKHISSYSDFLNIKKNYILIDNPSMTEIRVTVGARLTKSQKLYLYDLFMRLNKPRKAKRFLD